MRYWVYSSRRNREAAEAFAAGLRAEGHTVQMGATKHYHGEQHADVDAVFHDGDERVARANKGNAQQFNKLPEKKAAPRKKAARKKKAE